MEVLGCGSLFNAMAGVGQQLQKQIGQTGIPVYNVANACATGATALRTVLLTIKAGEADMGLAVGVEQMGKGGLLGVGGKGDRGRKVYEPSGRYGSVMQVEGLLGTGLMPGVFAQAGMEYAYEHGGVDFEQFAKVAEKNHAHSTLNPLAHYQKQFSLDEIMAAEMMSLPEHVAHVLPEHRRLGRGRARVSEEKLRTLSKEQQQRAVKISASVLTTDPWTEHAQVQPDVNTLTRNAAKQAYETVGCRPAGSRPRRAARLLRDRRAHPLRQPDALRARRGRQVHRRARPLARRQDPGERVSGGLISKGHPIGATGIANVYEVATHLRGEAGDRQIEGAKVGLTHVIGLGSACAVHILEKAAV